MTAAVTALVEAGEVVRRADGTWLLTAEEHRHPLDGDAEVAPLVEPRRRVLIARDGSLAS